MTPQQFVGMASRLFAILLAIHSFQAVGMARALESAGSSDVTWVPYMLAGLYVLAALLLWFFPLTVGHKLVPRSRFEDRLQLPLNQTIVVACVVLGMYVVVARALPPLAAYLSVAAYWVGGGQKLSTLDASRHIDAVVGLIQLMVGLLLVTKAHLLSEHLLPRALRDSSAPDSAP